LLSREDILIALEGRCYLLIKHRKLWLVNTGCHFNVSAGDCLLGGPAVMSWIKDDEGWEVLTC